MFGLINGSSLTINSSDLYDLMLRGNLINAHLNSQIYLSNLHLYDTLSYGASLIEMNSTSNLTMLNTSITNILATYTNGSLIN
jgi:hypothetical protein